MREIIRKTKNVTFQKIILITALFISTNAIADSPIRLQHVTINVHNQKSVERGAKFFASNCMVCHSLKYLKHNTLVLKAGIDYEKMPIQSQSWWAAKPPPDLSLIARVRGADWIYTYLHSFYQDTSRSSGSNNLLVENTNMPNPFLGLQGTQILVTDKKQFQPHLLAKKPQWFDVLDLEKQGSMTPEDFDNTIADVVNFLVYTSDPERPKREDIGLGVLIFLFIFLILTYFLKKDYWRNIKKDKKKNKKTKASQFNKKD